MACPAIPPIPIWLTVLAAPTSAAGAAAAFAAVSGVVKAIGFTSAAATVQFGGTDNAADRLRLAHARLHRGRGALARVEDGRREVIRRDATRP